MKKRGMCALERICGDGLRPLVDLTGVLHGGLIVGFANDVSYATKMRHMRTGIRLNARIGLRGEWKERRETLSADGYTVDISPKRCLAIVAHGFPLGQKIVVTNTLSGKP